MRGSIVRTAGTLTAALMVVAGCATQAPAPQVQARSEAPMPGEVLARNERFALYVAGPGDTLASIAKQFIGDERLQGEIADLNRVARVAPGQLVAVPLRPQNPLGISPDGFQTIPILCYHRLGTSPARMIVTRDSFAAQLDYLAKNGYTVVPLSQLLDFLRGTGRLPKKAVVITFDDGSASVYQYAYPLLKKHNFPATVFLYTDVIGGRDSLGWPQIREMQQSGLIDFQSHSKTHSNLTIRLENETEQQYRARLDNEIRGARDLIQRNLQNSVTHYAFPYGDANEMVLERLAQSDHRLGLTVNPGGNAFFAHPLMLRRTMVFGEYNLEQFEKTLQVFRPLDLR
jgi:peptidoglycan/xylan/chitin deacetylase (PgdA/CDA1 family)